MADEVFLSDESIDTIVMMVKVAEQIAGKRPVHEVVEMHLRSAQLMQRLLMEKAFDVKAKELMVGKNVS